MKKKYEREELIALCERAVVHHTKWSDRDSFMAQRTIQSIYKGLTAGLSFKIKNETDETIYISFNQPINNTKLKEGKHLKISSREDYFKDCDPEYDTEMFDGDGIDFNCEYTDGYMPTEKRLQETINSDWY